MDQKEKDEIEKGYEKTAGKRLGITFSRMDEITKRAKCIVITYEKSVPNALTRGIDGVVKDLKLSKIEERVLSFTLGRIYADM